jgi:C4-dicarboxylate-binding protein DctP
MQVNEISPADKALFVEATRPVYQQFEASVGKEFLDFARGELGSA